MEPGVYLVDDFLAYTLGIVVYFVGRTLNHHIAFLRHYNIPEPVTGGLLASLAIFGFYALTAVQLDFELETRDRLLVYFFTALGLNARVTDLLNGGRPLVVLLVLTLGYIFIQNGVGIAAATYLDQPTAVGVVVGSASLIGGHGTTIAWAPDIAAEHGIDNALEIGIAAATLGLVMASLLGGPIARLLLVITKTPTHVEDERMVNLAYQGVARERINHVSIMAVLLTLHIAMIIGYAMNLGFEALGLKLPLFVSCLLAAMILSNTVPYLMPHLRWPARTRALAVVSEFSLGVFIAMSLMSMQLWTIGDLAGPLLTILAVQAVIATLFILFIFFPLMGRDYQAVVLSAGFAGFCLGATPTAIANMSAVTKTYGPAP
ncbi:MAG: sodium/glutamate symporter, partial [Pseudomonadota bacterium]